MLPFKLGFLILSLLGIAVYQMKSGDGIVSNLLEAVSIVLLLTILKLTTDGRKENYID